ncbi:MAG: ABC transporter ATP-binding protein [Candidatus Poribacteria bacterium]|nr:ABC transporter ATP-binding protein [Candidatus Poribacteria bacterium]
MKQNRLLWAFKFLLPYKYHYLFGILCSLAMGAAQLIIPWVRKLIIDDGLIQQNNEALITAILIFGGVVVLSIALTWGMNLAFAFVTGRYAADMRTGIFKHLRSLSVSYFHGERTGQIISRLTDDVPVVKDTVTSTLTQLATQILSLTLAFIVALRIEPKLTLIMLPVVCAAGLQSLIFAPFNRRVGRARQDYAADVLSELHEGITGSKEILAFGRSNWQIAQFRELFLRLVGVERRQAVVQSASFSVTYLFIWIPSLLLFLLGGRLVVQGEMTVGTLFAFIGYVEAMAYPIRSFQETIGRIQTAMGAVDRITEFMDVQPQVSELPTAKPLQNVEGTITMENVSFAYEPEKPVIQDITFTIPARQKVAIVGASGVGKSTLVDLLLRFYDPQQGKICIDGFDVREATLDSLRSQIAVVFQDPFLFAGTVRDNIRFGKLDASDEEVVAAAKAANADQFISQLQHGYDTPIGEQGVTLSGGEKQRIAIARAVLKNPKILLLDEATSALDNRTEREIWEALAHLMEGKTVLIIAHRLSTVTQADQIIVLVDGKIAEIGNHEELRRSEGPYTDIFAMQRAS